MNIKQNHLGFTLIELLVVISIIGLLTTITAVAINNARGKARDSRRTADLKLVQSVIELYYNNHGEYPAAGANCLQNGWAALSTALIADNLLASLPSDPLGNTGYTYVYCSDVNKPAQPQHQVLRARLENSSNSALEKDKDGIFTGEGGSVDCVDPYYCLYR